MSFNDFVMRSGLIQLLVVAAMIVSCASQQQKAIDKLAKFVDNVEACASDYSEQQWLVIEKQHDNILAEVNMRAPQMSPSEIRQISVQEGRYAAVIAKYSAKSMVTGAGNAVDYLSGFIEGFASDKEVKRYLEALGIEADDVNALTELLDSVDVQSLLKEMLSE